IPAHPAPREKAVDRGRSRIARARSISEAPRDPVAHRRDLCAARDVAELGLDKGDELVRGTIARFVEILHHARRQAVKRHLRKRFERPVAALDFDNCRITRLQPPAAANPDPLANPVGGGDAGKMFRRARIETRARDMLLARKRCGLDLKHQIEGLGETIIEEDGDLELHREITHGGSFGGAPQRIWWATRKCKDAQSAFRRYGGARAPSAVHSKGSA